MPAKKKIVIDTSWFISASINRKSRRTLYKLLSNTQLKIFYSDQLLDEYLRVMQRPYFKRIISAEQVNKFLQVTLPVMYKVTLKSEVNLSRDANDNHVIALAIDSKAGFIVTSDNDLLVLKKVGKIKVVTMAGFLTLL